MDRVAGPIGFVAGILLAVASWTVASEYAPHVAALLLWME